MGNYKPTKLIKYTLKTYFSSMNFIFWTILFSLFWVFMFAFIFSTGITSDIAEYYYAISHGELLIIVLGSATTGMASLLYAASHSIRYVTKYGRINERRFLLEFFMAHIILLLVLIIIFDFLSVVIFYLRFHKVFYPKDIIGLAVISILASSFMYLFSFVLAYVNVVIKKPAVQMLLGYFPLILAFITYAGLWVDFSFFVYLNPYNAIVSLVVSSYSGLKPFTGNYIGYMESIATGGYVSYANASLLYISLVLWCLVMYALAVLLLHKAYGVKLEEIMVVS